MSTTHNTAFLWIHIRSSANSRLKTIWDGGSETRKCCGGALNVWKVSHTLVIFSNSFRVASSTWFGRANFITSYNFSDVGCLKWRCNLVISEWGALTNHDMLPVTRSERYSPRVSHCPRHLDRVVTERPRELHSLWSSRTKNSALEFLFAWYPVRRIHHYQIWIWLTKTSECNICCVACSRLALITCQ